MILAISKYLFTASIRDKLYTSLISVMTLVGAVSWFLSSTVFVEQRAASVVYFAGFSRIAMMTGIIIFVCFNTHRIRCDREIEIILSKSITRTQFLIACWVNLAFLNISVVILQGMLLYCLGSARLWDVILWSETIFIESMLVSIFALLASIVFENVLTTVTLSIGFYIFARLVTFLAKSQASQLLFLYPETFFGILAKSVVQGISFLLPRLETSGKTSWIVYGIHYQEWSAFNRHALVYLGLLMIGSCLDIQKKQF